MTSPNVESSAAPLADARLAMRRQLQIVAVITAIAAALVAIVWFTSTRTQAANAHAPNDQAASANDRLHLSDAQLATIDVVPVSLVAFRDEVPAEGKIVANGDRATQVFAPYSGRVTKIVAGPGDAVKAGAPLFVMESPEYAQAQSDYLSAVAQTTLARNSEQRRRAAFEAKGGSLQDWQQAQSDLAAAVANAAAVRNKLRIFGASDAAIDDLEHSNKPTATSPVISPVNGVVTDRQIGPGQYLQAGQATAVYTVADLSDVWVIANVPESAAPDIEPGQSAVVRVLALPKQTFDATITSVAAQVDPITRRVPVRAVIDNAQHKLKPEMFATFTIFTSQASQSPAVRQEAVIYEGSDARVWILDKVGDISLRNIRVGRAAAGMVEVLAGLQAGDKVVTHGSLFIDRAAHPD